MNHSLISSYHWPAMTVFCMYRFLLASAIILLFRFTSDYILLGHKFPIIFLAAATTYLVLSGFMLMSALRRKKEFDKQLNFDTAVDVVVYLFMIWTSGGVFSGLGILLNVVIAGYGLLSHQRMALFLAAVASLCLLAMHTLSPGLPGYQAAGYMQVGILGTSFFITAFLSSRLSQKALASETLAEKRGADLENMEELAKQVLERVSSGLMVLNDKGGVTLINRRAFELLGKTPGNLAASVDILDNSLAKQWQLWKTDSQYGQFTFIPGSQEDELSGTIVSLSKNRGDVSLILLDDLRDLTKKAQQIQLASLGQFVASIAHEIRNPLSAINHAAQLLTESQSLAPEEQKLLSMISNQCDRMKHVIQNVLEISRPRATKSEIIQLNDWVEDFIETYKQSHESVKINFSNDNSRLNISADEAQLHQILSNLCDNGIRYSQEKTGEESVDLRIGHDQKTNIAYIDIYDHGPGIAEKDAGKIFEPFYTEGGGGTGLGLYLAKALTEANGGSIHLDTKNKTGAHFRVSFQEHRVAA